MIAAECHDLINKYYPDPVFKEWKPSEYDMKYRYNTPRKMKKLEADKAKEDAKLQLAYDKLFCQKKLVHNTIDLIDTYPSEIASLFLNTFKWTIEDIVKRHEAYRTYCDKIIETYGKDVYDRFGNLKYLIEVTTYGYSRRFHSETIYKHDLSEDEWNKWLNSSSNYTNKYFKDIKDTAKLCTDYRNWAMLKENDDICNAGSEAYPNAIRHMADVLNRICTDINKIFNGRKPTKCITEPHWGIDGKFNGILTDDISKASFKSFGAGGYAIQRFHYRFKITKLKN